MIYFIPKGTPFYTKNMNSTCGLKFGRKIPKYKNAVGQCDATGNCTAIEDHDCNGKGYKMCSGKENDGEQACIYVKSKPFHKIYFKQVAHLFITFLLTTNHVQCLIIS